MKNPKVLLVGGGTGGHAVPLFEVYKALRKELPEAKCIIVGSGSELERTVFDEAGPDYRAIPAGKVRRHEVWKNIPEIGKLIAGFVRAGIMLVGNRPDVIFSKGGFVSVPIIFWATLLRVPYFIHESDAEMGFSNKYAADKAQKIFVTFAPKQYHNLPIGNTVFSGPILRSELLEDDGRDVFEFANGDPVILVTGGSQGALVVNRTVAKILPDLLDNYNVIHQTGDNDFGWVENFRKTLTAQQKARYFMTNYLGKDEDIDLMIKALTIADLVISRAGSTITEIAALGKPSILIPYKYAASNHQSKNAEIMQEAGAAIVISEDVFNAQVLKEEIESLFADGGKKLKIVGHNAQSVFETNGLEMIVGEIIHYLNNTKRH